MITDYIKPGISTEKIDNLCFEYIRDNSGYSAPLFYRGYKKSVCTSLNPVICHRIPSDRTLVEGDILNIDVTSVVNDFYGDTSRMFVVPDISVKAKNLISTTLGH